VVLEVACNGCLTQQTQAPPPLGGSTDSAVPLVESSIYPRPPGAHSETGNYILFDWFVFKLAESY
jgi:hypothetical protein